MGFIWLIISIIGILGQFFIDYLVKQKKRKVRIAVFVLLLTIFAIILSAVEQNKDNDHLSEQLSKINVQNVELQNKLISRDSAIANIRFQYDSLLFQNAILHASLTTISKQQSEAKYLGEKTVEEINKSRDAIETLRQKSGIRSVSSELRTSIINILSTFTGRVAISSVANNPESDSLKIEFLNIFRDSGWEVKEGSTYISSQSRLGIRIKIRDANYPKRLESITESFNIANLKWAIQYDEALQVDDIYIMIDH